MEEKPIVKSKNVGREKDAKEKISRWIRPKEIKNRKQLVEIMQDKGMKTKGSYSDLHTAYECAYNEWYDDRRRERI